MDDSKWLSLDQIRVFLAGAEPVEFAAQGRTEVYGWVERVLVRYEYTRQGKAGKGLLRRYVEKMTGLSRAQVTRLITAYKATGRVKVAEYKRHRFASRYTKADVELLAYVDKAHGNLSGPATRRILERLARRGDWWAYVEGQPDPAAWATARLRAQLGRAPRQPRALPSPPALFHARPRRAHRRPGARCRAACRRASAAGRAAASPLRTCDVSEWQRPSPRRARSAPSSPWRSPSPRSRARATRTTS